MYLLNTIIVVLKPLYRIPEARIYWWAIYYKYYKKKLSIITFIYNSYFLITTKKVFGLIKMQTNNIFILVLKEFLVIENNKLNKAKFLTKLKKALVPETPLIFNGCILIQYKDTI